MSSTPVVSNVSPAFTSPASPTLLQTPTTRNEGLERRIRNLRRSPKSSSTLSAQPLLPSDLWTDSDDESESEENHTLRRGHTRLAISQSLMLNLEDGAEADMDCECKKLVEVPSSVLLVLTRE